MLFFDDYYYDSEERYKKIWNAEDEIESPSELSRISELSIPACELLWSYHIGRYIREEAETLEDEWEEICLFDFEERYDYLIKDYTEDRIEELIDLAERKLGVELMYSIEDDLVVIKK